MSFSGNTLSSKDITLLNQLKARRTSILQRIETLTNAVTIRGLGKDVSPDTFAEVKAARLKRFSEALKIIETNIAAASIADNTTYVQAKPNIENQKLNPADEPASRIWYYQFEKDFIAPAIKRLTKTMSKGKEVWKAVDDSALRKELLMLSKQILEHYQGRNLSTENLKNYIEAIEVADKELNRIRNSIFGYINLLPLAKAFMEANKDEAVLTGEFSRAHTIFTKNNLPDLVTKEKPLITINSDAERDFALMAIKFMKYFILDKNPDIQYDQRALRAAIATEMVQNIFKANETKFATHIHDYEAAILLATPIEAMIPPGRRSISSHKTITPPRIINDDETATTTSLNETTQTPLPILDVSQLVAADVTSHLSTSTKAIPSPLFKSQAIFSQPSVTLPINPRIPQQTLIEPPATAAAEEPSFFKRHKKKILWGLGLGLLVGLTIASGGVLAVVLSGAAAASVAVIGATALVNTIGLAIGLTATVGILGAAGTAAGCAVSDYCNNKTDELDPDYAYQAITDEWNTGRIYGQTGMPIPQPDKTVPTTGQRNTATNEDKTNFNQVIHSDTRDYTIIEQPLTPRI